MDSGTLVPHICCSDCFTTRDVVTDAAGNFCLVCRSERDMTITPEVEAATVAMQAARTPPEPPPFPCGGFSNATFRADLKAAAFADARELSRSVLRRLAVQKGGQ